jgi:hypothetical protein
MDRTSRQQVCKIEEAVSVETKERNQQRKTDYDIYMSRARLHATAVAAIVLSGKPKIDEPLSRAWTRTLQCYGVSPLPDHVFDNAARQNHQISAAQLLIREIIGGAEERARFEEIFKAAPVWLLTFTGAQYDGAFLKFVVPYKFEGLKWGRVGFVESQQWPLLPRGKITDGDPVPDEDARPWRSWWWHASEADKNQNFKPALSWTNEEELIFLLREYPELEKQLSRYEKLLLRKYLSARRPPRSSDD